MSPSLRRFLTALRMNHYQYVRRRLNLLLLIVVPGFFVTMAFYVFRQQLTPLQIYENGIQLNFMTTRRNFGGIFQALEAACTLAGLTGVFMILNAMKADRRLALCGYRPSEIVGARIAQMLLVAVFVSGVATAATALNFWSGQAEYTGLPPLGTEIRLDRLRADSVLAQLGLPIHEVTQVELTWSRVFRLFVAVCLGAGIYAAMGVFIGALIRRPMEGSYLMFALPFTDIVIVNTPIVSRALETWWAPFTPAYHPARLLEAAAFAESYPVEHVIGAVIVLLVVSTLALVTFRQLGRA